MEKKELIEKLLDTHTPVFKCPVKDCCIESITPLEFQEHLELDHDHKELLNLFDWDIKDGKIVIENEPLIDSRTIGNKPLEHLVCIDDEGKEKKYIASYLVKHFLDCCMLPNVSNTKIYNVMSNYSHIATVDCWTYDKKDRIWSYIVVHGSKLTRSIENEIDVILENTEDDRLDVAKEIAMNKYDRY